MTRAPAAPTVKVEEGAILRLTHSQHDSWTVRATWHRGELWLLSPDAVARGGRPPNYGIRWSDLIGWRVEIIQ